MADHKLCTFSEYKDSVIENVVTCSIDLLGMKLSEITSKIVHTEKGEDDFNPVFLYTAPNGVSYGSHAAIFNGWFEPYIKDFMGKAFDDPTNVYPFSFMGEIYKEVDKITAEWIGQE